ncbi:MAG: hypothetical protein GF375_07195 [Candidatus Omnitrophica bacterium]|nr:hypothetical protein [Candidatus Omnitrophota bacterium]MBD3269761.1 hypothetical protein [Candidatus Omnitrophota bacterium]
MFKTLIFSCIFLLQFYTLCFAESIGDLLKNPEDFSGKSVTIEGEVIGEPLRDKGGRWINVSEGEYKIGVFVKDPRVVEKIQSWGSYKQTGDYIRLKGIFYKSCPQHRTLGIHGEEITVEKRGLPREEILKPYKAKLAAFFFIICLTMGLIYFIKVKYGKRD